MAKNTSRSVATRKAATKRSKTLPEISTKASARPAKKTSVMSAPILVDPLFPQNSLPILDLEARGEKVSAKKPKKHAPVEEHQGKSNVGGKSRRELDNKHGVTQRTTASLAAMKREPRSNLSARASQKGPRKSVQT